MKTAYAPYKPEMMARAALVDEGISFKVSVEIAKRLKGMMSDKAAAYLEQVIAKKAAVPYTRFTNGVGHRKGHMASGRYPVKAARSFLALVRLCVANAENKGLGTPLRIVHLAAQRASQPYHYGRHRGITVKRTHLDIVMVETDESKRSERKPRKKGESSGAEEKKDAATLENARVNVGVNESVTVAEKSDLNETKEQDEHTAKQTPTEKAAPKPAPKSERITGTKSDEKKSAAKKPVKKSE